MLNSIVNLFLVTVAILLYLGGFPLAATAVMTILLVRGMLWAHRELGWFQDQTHVTDQTSRQ